MRITSALCLLVSWREKQKTTSTMTLEHFHGGLKCSYTHTKDKSSSTSVPLTRAMLVSSWLLSVELLGRVASAALPWLTSKAVPLQLLCLMHEPPPLSFMTSADRRVNVPPPKQSTLSLETLKSVWMIWFEGNPLVKFYLLSQIVTLCCCDSQTFCQFDTI